MATSPDLRISKQPTGALPVSGEINKINSSYCKNTVICLIGLVASMAFAGLLNYFGYDLTTTCFGGAAAALVILTLTFLIYHKCSKVRKKVRKIDITFLGKRQTIYVSQNMCIKELLNFFISKNKFNEVDTDAFVAEPLTPRIAAPDSQQAYKATPGGQDKYPDRYALNSRISQITDEHIHIRFKNHKEKEKDRSV